MGLVKKILSGGTNKNDVKIAKLELEKAKIQKDTEKEKSKKPEESPGVKGFLEFTKVNFERIQNVVLSLKSQLEVAIDKIHIAEGGKLSFKEKGLLKKEKSSCQEKLKYLYLSKDYLVYLSRYASGIELNEEQSSLIVKFAIYFDGVQVIEVEENEDDEDMTLVGMINQAKNEFIKKTKDYKFYFYEYIEKYYDKKISQLELPEVLSTIEIFKKTMVHSSVSNKQVRDEVSDSSILNTCPNCSAKVLPNVKFCSECGTKIEVKKPMFCEECGTSLESGTKFCSNCGHRAI